MYTRTYIYSSLFHYGLSQDIEYSFLCYIVGPCCLSILYTVVGIFWCSVTKSCWFQLFVTPCTAAHQASLSFTISQTLLKLKSIELVMPSNHLTLSHPLLLLPSILPSIRVFSNEWALCIRWPKYWSFSINKINKADKTLHGLYILGVRGRRWLIRGPQVSA